MGIHKIEQDWMDLSVEDSISLVKDNILDMELSDQKRNSKSQKNSKNKKKKKSSKTQTLTPNEENSSDFHQKVRRDLTGCKN